MDTITLNPAIDERLLPEEAAVSDYMTLLKPGVMSLVVFTGAVGLWMAPGAAEVHPLVQFITILCIALGSGAGGAINMWYDHDIDSIMKRTQKRPLPRGIIASSDALLLGIVLALVSVGLLGLATNWKAAGLLAFAILFYSVFYTMWLKRRTPQNIVIGGAAGAFPPVIGWLAVGAPLSWDPILYFMIVFLWTPPHFWALALYRNSDYAEAGIPMLPVTAGEASTKRHIIFYSALLWAATLLPSFVGSSGMLYLAAAALLGGYFFLLSVKVAMSKEPRTAMKLFGYSIIYLFILFGFLIIDSLVALQI
jgi:protoheme IX farnesyltransferase